MRRWVEIEHWSEKENGQNYWTHLIDLCNKMCRRKENVSLLHHEKSLASCRTHSTQTKRISWVDANNEYESKVTTYTHNHTSQLMLMLMLAHNARCRPWAHLNIPNACIAFAQCCRYHQFPVNFKQKTFIVYRILSSWIEIHFILCDQKDDGDDDSKTNGESIHELVYFVV